MDEAIIGRFEFFLGQSHLLAYAAAYLAGVLVSFTPCVYPVIPITAAVIGAQGGISAGRGLVLSLSFVLGLAVTYTAVGIFAALTGTLFGSIQSSPLTQGALGILFLLMGLAMLEVFHLSLERFMPRPLAMTGRKGIAGSFAVGLTSGFLLGPCTAPVLAVSLGVGTLLVLVGTFAGLLAGLPKSGAWMTGVKKIAGVVMLAAGAYFLYSAFIA
ncbi:MAG: sulfite exporter TauE/SafE family protein [Syntrophales bacterium]|nr:sulfite exporter TauE/SafE family protein [Syntrophales bacterium]